MLSYWEKETSCFLKQNWSLSRQDLVDVVAVAAVGELG